jgi:hypothetical protein
MPFAASVGLFSARVCCYGKSMALSRLMPTGLLCATTPARVRLQIEGNGPWLDASRLTWQPDQYESASGVGYTGWE